MAVQCGHCHRPHPTPYDVYLCSRNARNSQSRMGSAVTPTPTTPKWDAYPFSAPEQMVLNIRTEGRYAVDVGGALQRIVFLRLTRPVKGQFKDCLKIQTQHSEKLKLAAVRYPSGSWVFSADLRYKSDIDKALSIIAVNPLDAAKLYAEELGHCARCGVELTDERSRWNCIGPECEKHWPDFLAKIEDEKGVYRG